jgi:glycosyltransferase involved in cell wall biosynthesis
MSYKNIDIVIPTLGGMSLYKTIIAINSGSIKPKKIFCISYKNKLKNLKKFKNVKVITTNICNQVKQRNLGIKMCKQKYILQLDDDIFLKKNTLFLLYKALGRELPNAAVGPVFLDLQGKPIHSTNDNFIKNLYKFLICGADWGIHKSGKVTSLGIAYGISTDMAGESQKTEWLPGGCVLFHNNKRIKEFKKFNFSGKSYCEDIFFSLERSRLKINQFVISKAKVKTEFNKPKLGLIEFIKEIRIRFSLLKFTKGSFIRFFIWTISEFFIRLIHYR